MAVRYRQGSLEAFVTRLRRRNLALSFGVLLLLAMSMAMLVVSTQRAQRLAKLEIDFVACVSHELRTPLAVICSAAQNLTDGVVEAKHQVRQYGSIIGRQGRQLVDLVEQILLFAAGKEGRQHYNLRPVQIAQIIETALVNTAGVIGAAGFTIERKIEPHLPLVMGDASALTQCVQNLISNAVKYGGESRWMGIRAGIGAGGEVEVVVEDKGIGIDAADLVDIFEPFYRGKGATAARIHGTGLGLTLVKSISKAMGGRVSAKSVLGRGSSFALHLPALTEPTLELATAPEIGSQSERI